MTVRWREACKRSPSSQMAQTQTHHFIKWMLPGFSRRLFQQSSPRTRPSDGESDAGHPVRGGISLPHKIIPPAFVKHLVGERCDRAILKSSTGKSWEVKVGGGEGSLWLEEGWLDFVSEHDISVGELLVFRYDGNMTFHVTIFGISTCERHQQPFAEMGTKDDGKKRRVKDEKQIEDSKGCIDMKRKKKATKLSTEVCPVKPQIENPHFKVTLCPSNLRRGSSYLHIPRPFCRANDISHIKKMTLFDPKGRRWPVKVSHGRYRWSGFYSGWYEFSAMNSLKVGDECIFRLNKEEKAMDVSITRG